MRLFAYPRSFKDILTLQRKYIIPRYQREYSWELEQLEEFWNDIKGQILFEDSVYITQDYFIGSLVLVGDDEKGTDFLVVDGQQRLTTITILLSALTQIGKELEEKAFYKSCYSYIEGKDSEYNDFFKLVNETPKPFFQRAIQHIDKEEIPTNSEEEKALLYAYNFFYTHVNRERTQHENPILFLKALRDQIVKCSTIFITVDNEEDAQNIFETLNAKGKDLETLDLVKNKIFGVLNKEHPSDFAKDNWNNIKTNLRSRSESVSLSTFFRHFWIAHYSFATENKIYKLFQEKIPQTENDYKTFVNNLEIFSNHYIKAISPLHIDWKTQEERQVLYALMAINDFKVIQPRPLVTTLIGLYHNRLLKINDLNSIILKLEMFHFIFSAITSSRASGLESLYSRYSRQLNSSNDKVEIKKILSELSLKLKEKLNSEITYEGFEKKFISLKFSNNFTSDKKLIQYIFKLKEKSLMRTNELSIDLITLEHIHSQKIDTEWSHNIGNLLPLAKELNEDCKNYDLDKKIPILKKSELKQVKDFCEEMKSKKLWTRDLSDKRAQELSQEIYDLALKGKPPTIPPISP